MGKIFIIAEAGVNHNGDLKIAKKLIDVAVNAGADAVKFQTFKAEKIVCEGAAKAAYQKETTGELETQFKMLKKLELSKQMHVDLIEYCFNKNIQFLSTLFDIDSIYMLCELDISIIKIPSGNITNFPYLRAAAKTGKDIILSTGMCCMEEVCEAKEILLKNGVKMS